MPSAIEWTDETWNPLTGCTRVSPGCDHCYMFALYPRLRAMGVPGYETAPRRHSSNEGPVDSPINLEKPRRVFVNSMADLFHPKVPFSFTLGGVFSVMREAGQSNGGHVFQILTKTAGSGCRLVAPTPRPIPRRLARKHMDRNVRRKPEIRPQANRVSPHSGSHAIRVGGTFLERTDLSPWLSQQAVNWVIVGGESGPRARPMDLDWARALRDQATAARVPFFLKQLGGSPKKRAGAEALLDNRVWQALPEGCWIIMTLAERQFGHYLDPHTQGKHLVLQYYMQAWLPIMTTWNGRVLFIDAFAGPGEYTRR